MLTITFKKALIVSPPLTRWAVSSIKVEKVVNAPQKPTMRSSLALGLRKNFSSETAASSPIRKQPMRFTAKVPYGNRLPNT